MTARRLLIVSNRLPVTAGVAGGQVHLSDAGGGLATGLGGWHGQADTLWIGWPGDVSKADASLQEELQRRLREQRVEPVFLTAAEVERYYDGFSNRVLWPLFHYQVDRVPVDASGWESYYRVNQKFAEHVARVYQEGDAIWVHDYQLMLLPGLLRERLPDAPVGFFLHIPFPSSDVFRVLPWRREILSGLLGADLIGFHTLTYLSHFTASLFRVEGIKSRGDRVDTDGRTVRLGVFPMSVDAGAFEALACDPEVIADAQAIRADAGGRRILLGVDRLDYTKGIPRRLLALERLFIREPALRDAIRYIQIAVPSREKVDSYQVFRREVEEAVGRFNGGSATIRSTPIHYMHQSVTRRQLVALYSAADVMIVTPLRDGMNLVAKEFVASRPDGDGVLILSEFAGAADELRDAVVVNPYDVEALRLAIRQSLSMSEDERRQRMRKLRTSVIEHDVHKWAGEFIEQLVPSAATATAGRGASRVGAIVQSASTFWKAWRTR